MFFLLFGPNFLEPEPKNLGTQSWSLKLEYRLHNPGFKQHDVYLLPYISCYQ